MSEVGYNKKLNESSEAAEGASHSLWRPESTWEHVDESILPEDACLHKMF